MAAPLQQMPNGSIPIMSGVPQGGMPTILYQQPQQFVVAGGGHSHPQNGNGAAEYTPRKPYMRNAQEEHCKIFVGGVGKNTTEESLRAYFGKFGEILDSVIMKDKATNEPRGFGFVTFKAPEAVQAVIDQCNNGGHTLDGKMIDPKPAVPQGPGGPQGHPGHPGHPGPPVPQSQPPPQQNYDADKAQAFQASGGNPQYKGPMKISPELKIFVGGIGIGTTEDDVRKYFESYGKVIQVDMPYHHIYKCPKGFAFVGFDSMDAVMLITKDRYHQINGKTVEVKGADEQQAHLNKKRTEGKPVNIMTTMGRGQQRVSAPVQPGSIATVSGYGAYSNMATAASSQVLIPQVAAGGVTQYVQVPTAATGGGYVFDPATNTYYQLPGTVLTAGGGGLALAQGGAPGQATTAGGVVTSLAAAGGATQGMNNPYAGVALVGTVGGQQQILASPQLQRPAGVIASGEMISAAASGGNIAIGAYQNETSTFGPTRHILGAAGQQQPIAGTADPHVVYSTATSISAGDAAISTQRGFHPYGR